MEPDASLEYLSAQVQLVTATLELKVRALRGAPEEPAVLTRLFEARAAIDRTTSPAARELAQRFELGAHEMSVVWLLAAIALDLDARRFLVALGHDQVPDPSLDRIRTIVFGTRPSAEAIRVLAPTAPLRRLGLIERSDGGGAELHESRQTWAISRRVLSWLHGDTSLDPALVPLARLAQPRPPDELAIAPAAIAAARDAMRAPRAAVIATGAPGLGRRTLLASAAHEAGLAVLEIDARRLAKEPAAQLRAIARECKLLDRVPLVCNADDHLDAIGGDLGPELAGPLLVTARGAALRWDRPAIAIELAPPSSAQLEALWRVALPEASPSDVTHLATRYPLAPAIIRHAALAAHARASGRALRADDVDAGIRAVLDDRLGELARRVEITQSWADLVLPDEQDAALAELCARIRQRRTVYETWGFAAKLGKGLGVTALFSGPPGTGKTMAAGLVARELGLPLYVADPARITSKYIGETEQHLARLFDAAETGHAVLLFDEADSLFGKRTEVRTSNDRYANLETNYLLQRLERFTGTCILTSNHEAAIDPAFQRRLAVHVRFELPDEAERVRLWRALIPADAPLAPGVDLAGLASRYPLAGGHIRNAALRAAFVAADEGTAITAAHLDRAARSELEGMGKIAA